MSRNLLYLFHILAVSTVFLYVGIMQKKSSKFLFPLLLVTGIVIVLYHSYKLYEHLLSKHRIWVNLMHILLFGPLIIYIGYFGEETPRMWFEILLMLGFSALGYHAYYLLNEIL